jgi:sterol desaturase/sphingolipid hydroxylase (fatty acid hydroxylase superfamily)
MLDPVPDARIADDIARCGAKRPAAWARWVDRAVVVLLPAAGLFSPQGPRAFYTALAIGFAGLASGVLAGAGVVTWFAERRPERLQGPRRRPAMILEGVRDTSVAAWVAACLLAWPLAKMRSGLPTGLVWSLPDAGSVAATVAGTLGGLLALDAWLYAKHRLLHTRWLFPFHRAHHAYRDPTAFAGFAVGPVESLMTFWPVVLVALPWATHWAPLYFGLVGGFVLLNFYLHCGVRVGLIEATLPRMRINTSVFHNRHHANAEVNFGEAFILWDMLCRTREGDAGSRTAARKR